MARSAQHDAQVEQNHNGAGFLYTLSNISNIEAKSCYS